MIVRTLKEWRDQVRATLAKFEALDPESPPEGMALAEWAQMLEGFKVSCRELLAANLDRAPSEAAQIAAEEQVARAAAGFHDGHLVDPALTGGGAFDA